MRRLSILAVAYALSTSAAFAEDEWDYSMPHKNRCSEDGGQIQMNTCLGTEYEKIDSQLTSDYQRLVSLLADPTELRKAQDAWLQFRDLTCEYENSGIGKEGSLYPFAQYACLIDLTEKRTLDIHRYLDWNCNGCPERK